jgi:serine/threonine-protein kinase
MSDRPQPDQAADPGQLASDDPLVGHVIDGRYEVLSVLGEGGMGLVYKARHVVLNKPLALKVLRPEVSKNEEIITRFRQEAQSASAIGNEHIIDISDFGTLADGATYFVMEYLEGKDLTKAIDTERPFTPGRAIHIARQIGQALGDAHDAGIVHRDLKPDNVILVTRGQRTDFVKVLDFGIAKVGGGSSKLTRAGQVFGTPHYMSPEQCSGTGVDHRTDIYALGVILYEMITGEVPFDADTLMGVLTKHLYEQPVAPSDRQEGLSVPPALESLVMRCLAKNADERFQTMTELTNALDAVEAGLGPEAVAGGAPTAYREPTGKVATPNTMDMLQPEARASKRGLMLGIGAAAAVLLIGTVAVVALTSGGDDSVADSEPAEPAPAAAEPPPTPKPALDETKLEGQEEATEESGSSETETVSIASVPEGVEVWRGNELLGNTPVDVPRPTKGEPIDLELRKPGFESQAVRISSLTSESVQVSLTEEEKEPEVDPSDEADERRRAARREARRAARRRAEERRKAQQEAKQKTEQKQERRRRAYPQSEVLDPWGN